MENILTFWAFFHEGEVQYMWYIRMLVTKYVILKGLKLEFGLSKTRGMKNLLPTDVRLSCFLQERKVLVPQETWQLYRQEVSNLLSDTDIMSVGGTESTM
jgi:hypothetical protein